MSVWWEDWAGKGGKGASHRVHGMADMTFAFFPSPTDLRVQMMKHTKHDIVRALCALPKTQHDFSSFEVDTPASRLVVRGRKAQVGKRMRGD